jgi:hypothetical protein
VNFKQVRWVFYRVPIKSGRARTPGFLVHRDKVNSAEEQKVKLFRASASLKDKLTGENEDNTAANTHEGGPAAKDELHILRLGRTLASNVALLDE